MTVNLIVKKSKIHGKGVFAARDFKKGEVVLKWNPKVLKQSAAKRLSRREKDKVSYLDGRYLLMQAPEKYVNHSCAPNTFARGFFDIAKRSIKKGEEITTDYARAGILDDLRCRCGNKNCKKIIKA